MAPGYNFRTCGMSSDRVARYRLALLSQRHTRQVTRQQSENLRQ
jgi:hypothetical protein